jgi:DNA (cytosine-5)-methyltransferase 1
MEQLNELALFAGAGGGILGGKLLGWRTVCAVEWEPYPASVLCARQNDGLLPPFPIWDDVQTFDGKPWRGIVDVVSGGFPCQDISAAGKGAGIDGERSGMWGEMARIIREVQPRFVFVENSPMLTSRGLGRVLGDLASMGFDAEQRTLEQSIRGTEFGLWPTPDANCGTRGTELEWSPKRESGQKAQFSLNQAIKMWPTPQASDNRDRGNMSNPSIQRRLAIGKQIMLSQSVDPISGQLNPTWVEWLMGWPLGWTDLKPLEMDKSHCVQQQLGES